MLVPQVKAEEQATHALFSATSDERGEYRLLGLPPGEYVLTVKQPGFKTYRQSGITLRIEDRTAQDVRLEVGQPYADSGGDGRRSAAADGDGRGEFQCRPRQESRRFRSTAAISFRWSRSRRVWRCRAADRCCRASTAAGRARMNTCTTASACLQPEPGQVVFYPIIDGIEEFRLNINSYSPEYGRSNGGTVMVITKSGGNDFHGTSSNSFAMKI